MTVIVPSFSYLGSREKDTLSFYVRVAQYPFLIKPKIPQTAYAVCPLSFLFFLLQRKKYNYLFLLSYTISCTHCIFVQPPVQDICTKVQGI